MNRTLTITLHALDRYTERVDPTAARHQAAAAIREIASSARSRSTPRSWTGVPARPGTRYLYSAHHPGTCLVVKDGAVVTVFSRSTSKVWRERQRDQLYRPAA